MSLSNVQKKTVKTIADNCLSVRLRLLNRLVGAIFDNALRPHKIKASQLNILVALAAFGPTTSRQLCRVLHMDASTFSRTLTRLKSNGWLKTEPSGEGKILRIEITPAGLAKIEAVYPDWQIAQEQAESVLGASTAEIIVTAGNTHLLEGMTG